MGALGNVLPYLGAGASGAAQGYLQKRQLGFQEQDQERANQGLQLQQREYNHKFGQTPGDLFQALSKAVPQFGQVAQPSLSTDASWNLANMLGGQAQAQSEASLAERLARIRGAQDDSRSNWGDPRNVMGLMRQRDNLWGKIASLAKARRPDGSLDALFVQDNPQIQQELAEYGGDIAAYEQSIKKQIEFYDRLLGMFGGAGFQGNPAVAPGAGNTSTRPAMPLSDAERKQAAELDAILNR